MSELAVGAPLMALAAWRIASFIVFEEGPWNLMDRLRRRAGVVYAEPHEGGGAAETHGILAELLACLWCVGFWTALGAVFLWRFWPLVVLVLAVNAGAILVERWANGTR